MLRLRFVPFLSVLFVGGDGLFGEDDTLEDDTLVAP